MIHFDKFSVCTSPSEYSLIREEATGKLWRLRCFQEVPEGCTVLYAVGDVPRQYWGCKRWPVTN